MTKVTINIETAKQQIASCENKRTAYWAKYMEAVNKRDRTPLEDAAATRLSQQAESQRTEANRLRVLINEPIVQVAHQPNVKGWDAKQLLERIGKMQVIEL